MARVIGAFVAAILSTSILAGCGMSVPADPEGTLERVRYGVLRVGVSNNPPWAQTPDGSEPSGVEADLIRALAEELDAGIEWSTGGEEFLVTSLERGDLDIVIGGITEKTPWTEKAAVTRPYDEVTNAFGEREKHVMLLPMGENGFLVEVEKFLLETEPAT